MKYLARTEYTTAVARGSIIKSLMKSCFQRAKLLSVAQGTGIYSHPVHASHDQSRTNLHSLIQSGDKELISSVLSSQEIK